MACDYPIETERTEGREGKRVGGEGERERERERENRDVKESG
jgi:hypothetical protein